MLLKDIAYPSFNEVQDFATLPGILTLPITSQSPPVIFYVRNQSATIICNQLIKALQKHSS